KRFDALVRGIATEVGKMRIKRRADKFRNRMLRLANREIDDGLAGFDASNQLGGPHERGAGIDCWSSWGGRLALGGHNGHASTQRGRARGTGFRHNREGEVKTRLTIRNSGPFCSPRA